MKHLKLFQTEAEYTAYKDSEDFVLPNVSYAVDSAKPFFNQHVSSENEDFIIMTYESNPAVMDVCYYQGWAASPDVMYKSEAEKVTDIGTAFQGLQGNTNTYDYGYGTYGNNDLTEAFTSFNEFKYFTGVTSIGVGAFNGCTGLTSIVIPDSVTSIDMYAFISCSSLTSITIPDSVASIGRMAFNGCTSLTSIVIPDSVTSIAESTFYNCYSLIDVHIGSGITSIGVTAFCSCSGLTSITIPDSVKIIGRSAFNNCSSLTSVIIGNSVDSISDSAFDGCISLTSITIPDSVFSIGKYAFAYCSNLNEITCLATTAPNIESNTFQKIKQNGILKIPAGSSYSYRTWTSTSNYYLGSYNWTVQEI